jgi:hypothetical protein
MANLMKNNPKRVEVVWDDAVKYSYLTEDNEDLTPTRMLTKGEIVREDIDGIVIKNPHSVYKENGERSKKELNRKATFLFIPQGMILEIRNI